MNMSEKFIFDESSNIIIYGAATTGSILVDRLKAENLNVKGFIDKRAYEIDSLKGYPVWDIKSMELKEQINKDTVVIIAVKNVFQHQAILKQLIMYTSCRRYIYMPMVENDENAQEMKRAFNDLLYNGICFPYQLQTISDVQLNAFSRADNRKMVAGKVVVLVPAGLIFTNNVDERKSIWGDIPILAYFPHIRLFQFFENNDLGNIDSYLKFCMSASEGMEILQSDSWKNNVLENRKDVYDQMLNEYELSKDFFYNNAPSGKWNDKGYFNLTSGKHRATFWVSRRCRYIPLSISAEDEEKWINFEVAEKTYNYLDKMGIYSLDYTIDNPYFYRYRNIYGDFWNGVLAEIVCKLAEYSSTQYRKVSFSKIRVLNLFSENRYLARYLYKMGADITDISNDNETERIIDKAFHCNYMPQREINGTEYELVIVRRMSKDVESGRTLHYVLCHEYDVDYEERARKIGTTIGDEGIVNMYCIEFNIGK